MKIISIILAIISFTIAGWYLEHGHHIAGRILSGIVILLDLAAAMWYVSFGCLEDQQEE